jgi:phosphoenolpyruvate-protein phosphotransferase (PTS system enzyme I)
MNTLIEVKSGMILGEAASAGIARGPAVICRCDKPTVVPRRNVPDADLPVELARLDAAIADAAEQLRGLEAEVRTGSGPAVAAIFAAQWQMLHDPTLHDEITRRCLRDKVNLEAAVSDAADKLIEAFGRINDPIVRERAVDVRDVARRLLSQLLPHQNSEIRELPTGSIIVARELLPSLASGLGRVAALVAERGGTTAHAVILARSLGIPVVIHADGAVEKIHDGDALIVDGLAGRVFIEPSAEVQREYDRIEKDLLAQRHALKEFIDLPAVTRDGVAIKLSANAGTIADAATAAASRAEGIGLYRTEFAFLVHPHFPTEEQQYRIYRAAADQMQPHETVLRVLDVGSDKLLPYFPLPAEANPSLGRRGTRLLLGCPDILRAQLRAILRLSATHPVSLLFPMIGGVDEFVAARQAVEAAQAELLREHQPFNIHIRVGAMIETASAAIMARWIAHEADFLSVGTNDLVQYLLTTDRTSSAMAGYYEPLHPAVVQTLKHIVEAAAAEGKPVSFCGEIAGNPVYTELLLGLGVTTLSVAPGEVLDLKRVIRSLSVSDAQNLAKRALSVGTIREVKACVGTGLRPNDDGIFQRRAVQRWRGEGGGGA